MTRKREAAAVDSTTKGLGRRAFIRSAGTAAVSVALSQFPDLAFAVQPGTGLRLSTFCCNATPPLGETLVWDIKLTKILDPLLLKGVVLEHGEKRYVLCSLDWCLLCNESERLFREALARAAGTEPECVAIHCVHQHAAPYADEDAHRLLDEASSATPHLTKGFLDGLRTRAGQAVTDAVERLEPVDRIGCGMARVDRVASQRRIMGQDGKIITRYSEGARNPVMASLPEGYIDPMLKSISFARGAKILARLHYYATHPQTHSCDGSVSADIVGIAREALEQEEGIFQVYFNGCGANVTVGKYNNGTLQARDELMSRMKAGMRAAAAATHFVPVGRVVWRTEAMVLPIRTDDGFVQQLRANLAATQPGVRVYQGAMRMATVARAKQPFKVSSLQIGNIHIVHLPGEPMLEFQTFAQSCRPDDFVAVAGYGDCAPAYLCTDQAFAEGGYEPSNSISALGTEAVLKGAIQRLLGL
ncbi:MAG: hypothetical protein WC340_05875 [Kiritimatiellia bacterium]